MRSASRLPRSYLFVPGDRPERFDKALAAGADAVVLDLEDAVAPARKVLARHDVAKWLERSRASAGVQVLVRVNAPTTAESEADLRACAPLADGIVLPKAERPSDLELLHREWPSAELLPLIETAAGMDAARELATAPGVRRLMFGSIDFQHDVGIDGEGQELLFFRSRLVWMSRLAGIVSPVDGVSTVIDDADALREQARTARRLGFGAKLCIHPRQIIPVHEGLAPTAAQVEWARRVVAADAASGGAAVAVDGAMIDRPVVLRAQAILDVLPARRRIR
jgi:citrate lyase subunit beta/citryl-CoA lyase